MSFIRTRRTALPLAVLAVAGVALTACSGGSGSSGGGDDDKTVTIYGTIADTEAKLLEESWADFEKDSGITP